ncbi:MAG: hypothetical protein JWR24_1287 [Actinoallomurus sp.]|jgi:hypothetical protein|nr:hypothetical protein [Actinoallomurus sp.]
MSHETPSGTTLRILQELKRHAEAAGLAGRVVQTTRSKPPVLVLVNPDARQLSEEISCRERGANDWWLHWSWGDPIGRATDTAGALAAIRRVLGTRT